MCSAAPASANPPPVPPPHGIVGGHQTGQVSVSGSEGNGPSSGSDGSGSAPTPVGATELVACGENTLADLEGLGDPNASADAASCTYQVHACQVNRHQTEGASIQVQKQANGTWTANGSICTTPTTPVLTAAMVRDRAVRLIPTATLGLAPHDTTLINIQTIIWLNTPPTQHLPPVTILGHHITITLTLHHVTWDFGDHTSTTTTNPGTPYNNTHDPCHTPQCPHYFGHTYRTTGTHTIHATATWTATFTLTNTPPTTIPGTVNGPPTTTTITAKQARAILTPDPQHH